MHTRKSVHLFLHGFITTLLAGSSGYIYFGNLPGNFLEHPDTIELEVGTNRGRAIKMKLKVPDKDQR